MLLGKMYKLQRNVNVSWSHQLSGFFFSGVKTSTSLESNVSFGCKTGLFILIYIFRRKRRVLNYTGLIPAVLNYHIIYFQLYLFYSVLNTNTCISLRTNECHIYLLNLVTRQTISWYWGLSVKIISELLNKLVKKTYVTRSYLNPPDWIIFMLNFSPKNAKMSALICGVQNARWYFYVFRCVIILLPSC